MNNSDFNGTDSLPWLIFNLCNHTYAIHSKFVTGIMVPPDEITPVPEAPEIYRGITEIRGNVYPVLDMRKLFNFQTLENECLDFCQMMDERKQDHILWAEELKNSVAEGRSFSLTTDPHACKFGKWYDEFMKHPGNSEYILKKIEEPHKNLHQTAELIEKARELPDSPEKDSKIEELISLVMGEYVPEIVEIIVESKNRYRSYYRETMVLLSTGEANLAIVVDKVLAVDTIEIVNGGKNMSRIISSQYFIDVAHNNRVKGDILIIDETKIIDKAEREVPIE